MAWTELTFGKYIGKTLPQIVFKDPDWFFWAYETNAFQCQPALEREAKDVYLKETSIKIPQTEPTKTVAEYARDRGGKYARGDLVPVDRDPHDGSTSTMRLPAFNMRVPRIFSPHDKSGYKLFIKELKFYLFGNYKARLTKGLCEGFFDDAANFDSPGAVTRETSDTTPSRPA